MADRVCVFIDGANFYHQCKDSLGGRTDVNIGAFAAWLVGRARALVRMYYYTVSSVQRSFAGSTRREGPFPWEATSKALPRGAPRKARPSVDRVPRVRRQEREVDGEGRRYARGYRHAGARGKDLYDTAVLVTGDGDFAEAVQAVKDLGNHVEVACFVRGRSDALAQAADLIRDLTPADITPMLGGSPGGAPLGSNRDYVGISRFLLGGCPKRDVHPFC